MQKSNSYMEGQNSGLKDILGELPKREASLFRSQACFCADNFGMCSPDAALHTVIDLIFCSILFAKEHVSVALSSLESMCYFGLHSF
ncbi:hypothetical protein VNO80_06624 [Phaseolus coccineus]|uniref:Uncharacterized protein n=1 Tax=Phaseolus coccineus TaxID=3886 RepID=A0AAN9NIM8_PHACN